MSKLADPGSNSVADEEERKDATPVTIVEEDEEEERHDADPATKEQTLEARIVDGVEIHGLSFDPDAAEALIRTYPVTDHDEEADKRKDATSVEKEQASHELDVASVDGVEIRGLLLNPHNVETLKALAYVLVSSYFGAVDCWLDMEDMRQSRAFMKQMAKARLKGEEQQGDSEEKKSAPEEKEIDNSPQTIKLVATVRSITAVLDTLKDRLGPVIVHAIGLDQPGATESAVARLLIRARIHDVLALYEKARLSVDVREDVFVPELRMQFPHVPEFGIWTRGEI